MKKSSVIVMLLLGAMILRSDDCGGFGDSNSSSSDSTTHKTQIIAKLSGYFSEEEEIEVTIDGQVAGKVEGSIIELTKQVESGKHTISAVGLINESEKWPTTEIEVEPGQTFTQSFHVDKVQLTISPSIACKTKGVKIVKVEISGNYSNLLFKSYTLTPGEPATIEAFNGPTHIITYDEDAPGTILYSGNTPFLAGGSSYSVAINCD